MASSRHPEAEADEVFLTNEQWGESLDKPFYAKWPTKRAGKIAYSILGDRLSNYFPVFVKRTDVEKNGGFMDESMGVDAFFR